MANYLGKCKYIYSVYIHKYVIEIKVNYIKIIIFTVGLHSWNMNLWVDIYITYITYIYITYKFI